MLLAIGTRARRHWRRRGAAYFLVIGASMLVAVIGLSAITVARLRTRTLSGANDVREAGILAFSAIEHVLTIVDANAASWRMTFSSGVETTAIPLGRGTYSGMLMDENDNDLANNNSDPVRLYGIGRVGAAMRVYSVLLSPNGSALTSLEADLHAGNNLIFNGSNVQCDQIISGNQNVIATNSLINANVEVVGAYSGGTFGSTPTTGITPRTMPDPNTVFDYYIANGTTIDYVSLPSFSSGRIIEEVLLSPSSNPYGTGQTNTQGIYVVDCVNNKITIQNCRIVGTLVVLNAGAQSEVSNQLNWEPAVVNYPSLMVQGTMDFKFDATQTLNEVGVNYNPVGTPYKGVEDALFDDSYPTLIKGLVYVSSNVSTLNAPTFDGVVVVGGLLNDSSTLNLTYRQTFLDNPPPGFSAGDKMVPGPGTWQRAVLPAGS